jgi:hypothetical protein
MNKDTRIDIDSGLTGLEGDAWFTQLEEVSEDLGYFERLEKHAAAFIDAGPKLLVTFENAETIQDRDKDCEPFGFQFVREDGWSHLGIYAQSESWYREKRVFGYFDRLIDDGFFEDFDDVLFYGANAGAYAATAYSVAAPGCRVLAIRPQATLDPRIAGFDQRYRDQRIKDFSSRYGYGPDMIDAANRAYVAFDPHQMMDAVHAALFTKPNMTPLRCHGLGARLNRALIGLEILDDMVRDAMDGTLTTQSFGTFLRARRTYAPYLRNLFNQTMKRDRMDLAVNVCAHAMRVGHTRFFADQFDILTGQGFQPYRPVKIKAAE